MDFGIIAMNCYSTFSRFSKFWLHYQIGLNFGGEGLPPLQVYTLRILSPSDMKQWVLFGKLFDNEFKYLVKDVNMEVFFAIILFTLIDSHSAFLDNPISWLQSQKLWCDMPLVTSSVYHINRFESSPETRQVYSVNASMVKPFTSVHQTDLR